MITYFKDKNHKAKKKYKIYKTLTSILKSVDTLVIIGATTTSVTLSVIGVGKKVAPISARIACALSLGTKVIHVQCELFCLMWTVLFNVNCSV